TPEKFVKITGKPIPGHDSATEANTTPEKFVKTTDSPTTGTTMRVQLTEAQERNTRTITQTALNYNTNAPYQACLAAMTAAITETEIYIYANSRVPASMNYHYDGVTTEQDYVGIFQYPASRFRNIGADMDPAYATQIFLYQMVRISGWQNMDPGTLAQQVQHRG
ncbi:hypothetical protein A4X03_0g7447, partial [Tilletia caries]